MADTVGHHRMARTSNSHQREGNHEYERPRIWPLAIGRDQRAGVHPSVADLAHSGHVPDPGDDVVRLARREERDAQAEFGEAYARYAASTPAFFPHLRRKPAETSSR